MEHDLLPADDAAEKRVEESREQLDRHLDQLSEKLRPSNLASSALDDLDPAGRLKSAARNRSIWVAVLGAVVGLVALRGWRKRRSRRGLALPSQRLITARSDTASAGSGAQR